MQHFDHLLTTRPHDIRMIFIADLHLSADTPALNGAFLALLKDLSALPKLDKLFILGDWLDGWIGDDDYLSLDDTERQEHFLTPILHALKKLSLKTQIYLMHGNRDFAIRQGLCDEFAGTLIGEPYFLNLDKTYRLEHGDRLCTDDKAYQRYRKIIQNPIITWLLLKQPLAKRRKLAEKIKTQSKQGKSQKSAHIMDANEQAIAHALASCDVLIHGHTHRPHRHTHHNKTRLVLGDWRCANGQVTAVIGAFITPQNQHTQAGSQMVLCQFTITDKHTHRAVKLPQNQAVV